MVIERTGVSTSVSAAFGSAALLAFPLAVYSGFALAPLFIVVSVVCLFVAIRQRSFAFLHSRMYFALLVFLSWGLVSVSWSIEPAATLKVWAQTLALVTLGFIGLDMASYLSEQQRYRLKLLLCIGFYVGAVLLYIEIVSDVAGVKFIRKLVSPESTDIYNSNALNKAACFFALVIWPLLLSVPSMYFAERWPGMNKIYAFVAWLLTLILLSQLQSSSAVMGLIAGTVAFLFIVLLRAKFAVLVSIATMLVIGFTPWGMSQIQPGAIKENYQNIPDSALHRLHIWQFASEKAREKNIIGWGLQSSRYIPGGQEKTILRENHFRERLPSHPHNNVLQIWLELGMVGVCLWLIFYYVVLRHLNIINVRPVEKAAAHAMMVSATVIGMLAFDMWRQWWIGAIFLAAILLRAVVYCDSVSCSSNPASKQN